jgi:hypothetical protein
MNTLIFSKLNLDEIIQAAAAVQLRGRIMLLTFINEENANVTVENEPEITDVGVFTSWCPLSKLNTEIANF